MKTLVGAIEPEPPKPPSAPWYTTRASSGVVTWSTGGTVLNTTCSSAMVIFS